MSDENNKQGKKKRSLLNILTLMSFILLCLTGLLFYLSYRINAWEESFSLRDDFHISLYRRANDCRLAFFNVKNYPYTGSVVTRDTKIRGFGNFLGIYYRHLSSVEGEGVWWTLYISLWWPVVLFSILPGLFLYRKQRDHYKKLMNNHDKTYNSKPVLLHHCNGNIELIEHPNIKWYQIENNARLLSGDFCKHVLILRIIYNIEGKEHVVFLTGSPLLYKDKYLWLTAGHVIKEIQGIVCNDSYRIRDMSWFDNYEDEDAGAIPIGDFKRLFNSSIDNKDKGDIGIVKFDELTIQNLKANKNLQWLDENMWKNIDKAKPDGYYLVGTPYEMTKTRIERVGNTFKGKSDIYIICVPVERIESDIQKEPKEFWNYPGFIFGKIIPVHKQNGEQLQSIEGMSGGLVFSVEIENIKKSGTSGIRYRLFGIQSSWLPESKIIRATPIEKIVGYLEQNVDKLN